MKDKRVISLGFTNQRFQPGVHICLIYRDESERRKIISHYLESGLKDEEKIEYFMDIMTPDELILWLNELGIDTQKEIEKEQFQIQSALDVYCPDGEFKAERMLHALEDFHDKALDAGFTGARVTGETSWLSQKIPGCNHFIEYEAQINNIIQKKPVTIMCQYDARLFDGATIFDVLQVHPLMVVQGQVVRNPAYIQPKEFLKQLQARK